LPRHIDICGRSSLVLDWPSIYGDFVMMAVQVNMGMEVAGSEVPQVNGETNTTLHDKENGKVNVSEPIKFGSHGVDEPKGKGDTKHVANANLPKDAVDEWPADPQVHSFWFVKYRLFEDPSLKAKIEKTDKEILKANQRRSQIIEELKPKRVSLNSQVLVGLMLPSCFIIM